MSYPGPEDLRLEAGRRAHRSGDRRSAEALYRECLNSGAAAVPAALLLAQLLGETGRLGEAEAVLRPLVATGGPPARLLLARVTSGLERHEEALGLLSDLNGCRPAPLLAEARLLAAEALEGLERSGEARASLEAAVAQFPEHPVLFNRLGVLLHGEGDADGAVSRFERSLALRPGHPGVTANLAAALAMAGDFDAAMARYLDVLERLPGHRQAVMGYVGLLQELGAWRRRSFMRGNSWPPIRMTRTFLRLLQAWTRRRGIRRQLNRGSPRRWRLTRGTRGPAPAGPS